MLNLPLSPDDSDQESESRNGVDGLQAMQVDSNPVVTNHISMDFVSMLAENVLAPFFEYDSSWAKNKVLVQNAFINFVRIFEDPRVKSLIRGNNDTSAINTSSSVEGKFSIWQYFRSRYSLKPQQSARQNLCSLVTKNEAVI